MENRASALLARRLRRSNLYFVSIFILSLALIFLVFWIVAGTRGKRLLGLPLGADFPAFYVAGTILNQHSPDRLYDLELQNQLYHALAPAASPDEFLPYANAPFLAEFFRPLAALPYAVAFTVWLVIALALYFGSLAMILSVSESISNRDRPLAFLLTISFIPFLIECWLGGQIAVIGCAALCLFYWCRTRHLPMLAGAVLSVCLYKITILPLLLSMLVVGRQWRTLVGFVFGGGLIVAICIVFVGPEASRGYLRLLQHYVQVNAAGPALFRTWKFIDLRAFLRLMPRPAMWIAIIPTFLGAMAAGASLAVSWWRLSRASSDVRRLLFAATLSWMLVLSLYTPIYDSILVAISALITADVLLRQNPALPDGFKWLALLLYITPFFTQGFARFSGFQPLTLVLTGFGIYQLRLAWSFYRKEPRPPQPALQFQSAV